VGLAAMVLLGCPSSPATRMQVDAEIVPGDVPMVEETVDAAGGFGLCDPCVGEGTCQEGSCVALADGTLLRGVWGPYLPYDPVPYDGYLQRSRDGGTTWTEARVVDGRPGYLFWPKRLRALRDGRILAGGGLLHVTADNDTRRGSLVTGQQSIQRRGIGLTDRREVRSQVGQTTVGHRQLGCGPVGRSPPEQRRGTLNGHAQRIREITGSAGGHGRRGQHSEDQHQANSGHCQPSGPLPGPTSDQPTWPARLRRDRALGRQSLAQCSFGPHLGVSGQMHFCQPA